MKHIQYTLLHHKTYRIISLVAVVFIIAFTATHMLGQTSSQAEAAISSELSYKTVRIMSNDTLWSIAEENYTEEYGSVKDYIKEIKECNSLTSDDIDAGCSIIVPIYVAPDQS